MKIGDVFEYNGKYFYVEPGSLYDSANGAECMKCGASGICKNQDFPECDGIIFVNISKKLYEDFITADKFINKYEKIIKENIEKLKELEKEVSKTDYRILRDKRDNILSEQKIRHDGIVYWRKQRASLKYS